MTMLRAALVGLLLFALFGFGSPAQAGPTVDQQCEGIHGGGGSGGTYTQTFTPKAQSLGRIDVLLESEKKRGPDPIRLRIIRKQSLAAGLATQAVVLAEQEIRLPLQAKRTTWAVVQLPEPITLASAVPAFDRLAIELVLPEFDNTLRWVGCTRYQGGVMSGSVNGSPRVGPRTLMPYGLDVGVGVTQDIPYDLAFRTYAATR